MIRAAEGNFLCGERAYVKYSQTACILHKEEFNWHWIVRIFEAKRLGNVSYTC